MRYYHGMHLALAAMASLGMAPPAVEPSPQPTRRARTRAKVNGLYFPDELPKPDVYFESERPLSKRQKRRLRGKGTRP